MDCHYNNQHIEIYNQVYESTTLFAPFSYNNSQIHTADKGHVKSKEIIWLIPPMTVITRHRRCKPCEKDMATFIYCYTEHRSFNLFPNYNWSP